jgi:hypothetical protein
MAAKDLITLARAKQNIQSITDSSQDALLTTLITAISDAIEKYCRRDFTSKSYDELYSGSGDHRLLLRGYPIQSVQSVRYRLVAVLKVTNTNQALNQQARVSVTSTGLTLTRVASGVSSTDTSVTWAGNPTIQGVATAVNALGNGWSAQIVGDPGGTGGSGDYGLWPSADLYVKPSYGDGTSSQGALSARGVFAELRLHTYELSGWQLDPRGWLLRAIPYTDPELMHPEDLIWPVGINNFRVQYTAGYTTIPESIQEAAAEWVSIAYFSTIRDPSLAGQTVPGSLAQHWANVRTTNLLPPPSVAQLLAPFRRYTVGTNQG